MVPDRAAAGDAPVHRRARLEFVGSTRSMSWERLSARSQAILRLIAIPPISEGWSLGEIAAELGTSPHWVSARLVELRADLREIADA